MTEEEIQEIAEKINQVVILNPTQKQTVVDVLRRHSQDEHIRSVIRVNDLS